LQATFGQNKARSRVTARALSPGPQIGRDGEQVGNMAGRARAGYRGFLMPKRCNRPSPWRCCIMVDSTASILFEPRDRDLEDDPSWLAAGFQFARRIFTSRERNRAACALDRNYRNQQMTLIGRA
jgi:hypothetical protein